MDLVLGESPIHIFPVAALIFAALLPILWRRTRSIVALFCFVIFAIYLLLALDKAFFPIVISGPYADEMRQIRQISSFINLIPFNFNLSEMPNLVFLQIYQNILLTVPFGFGIHFFVSLRARQVVWLALAMGVGIEAVQAIISLLLRYPYRVIDVNDMLLNGLGVIIGYSLFRIFAWMFVRAARWLGFYQWTPAAYVYEVTSRADHRSSRADHGTQ